MGGRVDDNSERRLRALLVVVLLTIVVSGTVDLILDAPESWRSGHVLYEVLLIVGALAMAAVVWRGWLRTARSLAQTRRALDERQTERDAWRASATPIRSRGCVGGQSSRRSSSRISFFPRE